MIETKTMFGGAAVVGILAAGWDKLKLYLSKLYSLIFVCIQTEGSLSLALTELLMKEFKCSPVGKKKYSGINEYVRPIERAQLVGFEQIPEEPTIWWRGFRPIVVKGGDNPYARMELTFIRGVYVRDVLLVEAINKFNKKNSEKNWKKTDRFYVSRKCGCLGEPRFKQEGNSPTENDSSPERAMIHTIEKFTSRPLQWSREELGQPKRTGAMDNLSLQTVHLKALEEAIRWRESEQWFKQRLIPWKRGWLLAGDPGTGKSAFVRALGQELNVPIYIFDLSTMTNQDFVREWDRCKNHAPCIYLFEDFDSVFEMRKNVAVHALEHGLTFDCFLNTMDGVENTDGLFVIITTNNISVIDPAIGNPTNGGDMSTRPGRIDRIIRFGPLDEKGKCKMANRILRDWPYEKWEHLITEKAYTGAQFQEKCCRLALDLFWDDVNK